MLTSNFLLPACATILLMLLEPSGLNLSLIGYQTWELHIMHDTWNFKSLQGQNEKINCLLGPLHFYNRKFKERTSNNYSASCSMGSCPFALVITIPTVSTGINRFSIF